MRNMDGSGTDGTVAMATTASITGAKAAMAGIGAYGHFPHPSPIAEMRRAIGCHVTETSRHGLWPHYIKHHSDCSRACGRYHRRVQFEKNPRCSLDRQQPTHPDARDDRRPQSGTFRAKTASPKDQERRSVLIASIAFFCN